MGARAALGCFQGPGRFAHRRARCRAGGGAGYGAGGLQARARGYRLCWLDERTVERLRRWDADRLPDVELGDLGDSPPIRGPERLVEPTRPVVETRDRPEVLVALDDVRHGLDQASFIQDALADRLPWRGGEHGRFGAGLDARGCGLVAGVVEIAALAHGR